jgi:hypothetical protein
LLADVAEVAALLADVAAADALSEADEAEEAALVAEASASNAFSVTWLIVTFALASPAPPVPRKIANVVSPD